MNIFRVILFCSAISFASCKAVKNASYSKNVIERLEVKDADDEEKLLQLIDSSLQENKILFDTYSARLSLEFTGADGKTNNFNAVARIQKDSIIWISVTAALGIEGLRVKVTPDSITLINKLEQNWFSRDISFLQQMSGLPLNFNELQDLFVGNPLSVSHTRTGWEVNKNPLEVHLKYEGYHFLGKLLLEPDFFLLKAEELEFNGLVENKAVLNYKNFFSIYGKKIAGERTISLTGSTNFTLKIKVREVEFNEPLSFPFSIPQNYLKI